MTAEDDTIPSAEPTKPTSQYTYRPGTDGVDDTWDIYDPYGKFVVSILYWADESGVEAAVTLERAKLIVDTLNKGYWW